MTRSRVRSNSLDEKIVYNLISNSEDIDFKSIIDGPFQSHLSGRSAVWIRRQSILTIAWALIGIAMFIFITTITDGGIVVLILLSVGLAMLFSTTASIKKALRGELQNSPIRSGETHFSLSEDGVETSHPACSSKVNWEYVTQIEKAPDCLLLCFGIYDRLPISRKAFVDDAHFDEVFKQCEGWSNRVNAA